MSPKAIITNEELISNNVVENNLIFQFEQIQRFVLAPQRNDLTIIILPLKRNLIQQEIAIRNRRSIPNIFINLIGSLSNFFYICHAFYFF
jgi:hypothetical protein